MRYLVISDSHGYNGNLPKVMEMAGEVEAIFHLGDLQCAPEEIERVTKSNVIAISGNNDFRPELKPMRVIPREGHKILMTHGHRQMVNFGSLDRLVYLGEENEADIVMFGHTHVPCVRQQGRITLVNPGSISLPRQGSRRPTFIIMEIKKDGSVTFDIHEL